jgi:predicted ferric reductase
VKVFVGKPTDWRIRKPHRPTTPYVSSAWAGPAIAVASIVVGWWAFKDAVGREENVAFALFVGSVSIMMMAWSNMLSTRINAVESVFGGLDRVYKWHRWFGALAVAAMWLHTENVDDVKGIRGASKNVADAAEDLAETATNVLYVLIAISVLRWVPTRWWRLTHKFLIVPYAIACWHFYTATKPYANGSAWGVWFGAWMLAGLAAWAYRVVWRDMIQRGHTYRVVNIVKDGGATSIDVEPVGKPMRHKPGQFAFLKLDTAGMKEPHPFTIASSPGDTVLRFVIKDLGDWTGRLAESVVRGDSALIEGPYGRLQLTPRKCGVRTVWIAGGVGITPFLGAAVARRADAVPVPHLFYCVRSRTEAPGLAALEQAAREGRITLDLRVSSEGTRLDGGALVHEFGDSGLENSHIVMCGPDSLLRTMKRAANGLGARHIHVEEFDIRAGVGPDLSREVDEVVRYRRMPVSFRR